MGIADTVQLLSQIYNGDKRISKLRFSRSRLFQKRSDTEPLGQHVSESSSFPEEQDLKIAGGLLNPTSVQTQNASVSKGSCTQDIHTLQTLDPDVPYKEYDNCAQISSDPSIQPGLMRYYSSLPKINTIGHTVPDVPTVQNDTIPRTRSRSARANKFLSISRVFRNKRSGNLRIPSTISGGTNPSGPSSHPQSSAQDVHIDSGAENQTPRKASEQTVMSEESTRTVCRHPSQRYEDAIVPLERIEDRQEDNNPFTDQDGPPDRSRGSDPFRSTGGSSDQTDIFLSTESAPFTEREHYVEIPVKKSPKPPSLLPPPRNQSRSWDSLSYRIFSDTSIAMRNFDQSRAAHDFNFFAMKLDLVPLAVDRSGRPITGSPFSLVPATARKSASTILRSIRSFKSTMTLKRQDNIGKRTLRRMKTLANISTQYQMSSLKGKPIEALARLGGHSFLTLPSGFAPITLKLPVCFAATAHYVAVHGRMMPHIFLDCGDDKVVRKLYNHFARQVLSAELTKDKIDSTTRGSFIPSDSLSSDPSHRPNKSTYIHNVATAFKHFLAGLPGGILGSVELYSVLKRIHDHNFDEEELKTDPAFGDYSADDISASSAVKVKMVALALLALSTDVQLELICAVFGLTSLIAQETEKQVARPHGRMHEDGLTCSGCSGCQGFSNSKTLGEIFGPLLLSGPAGINPSEINFLGERSIKVGAAGVATMLIEIWKDVCVQFQRWKVFCPISGS